MDHTLKKILRDFFKANSYPIGCTVKINGIWGSHIIREVRLTDCDEQRFMYGTNRSAWHNHEDLKLVSLPCKESYTKLLQDLNAEEASDLL